jgi:hypothetical protein
MPKLPLVVRWIDQTLAAHAHQTRPVASFGFARLPNYFSTELLQHAKVVGVARVPVPPLTALGLPEFASFEKGDYSGITFKNTYFVQERRLTDESIHFHELVHVIQWEYLGVERFLLAYGAGLIARGYRDSPVEAMAYELQRRFQRNEPPFDVATAVRTKLDELKL